MTEVEMSLGWLSPYIRLGVEKGRESGVLVIAASIIAVIRLRGKSLGPSPKLTATIRDAVQLARLVMAEVERRG